MEGGREGRNGGMDGSRRGGRKGGRLAKPGMLLCLYNSNVGETETRGYLEIIGKPAYLN